MVLSVLREDHQIIYVGAAEAPASYSVLIDVRVGRVGPFVHLSVQYSMPIELGFDEGLEELSAR